MLRRVPLISFNKIYFLFSIFKYLTDISPNARKIFTCLFIATGFFSQSVAMATVPGCVAWFQENGAFPNTANCTINCLLAPKGGLEHFTCKSDCTTYCSGAYIDDGKDLGDGPDCSGPSGIPSKQVGDPINAASGNFFQAETDVVFTSQLLSFSRYYNSDFTVQPTNMGLHWRHSFDASISLPSIDGGSVSINRPDGKMYTYTPDNGVWVTLGDIKNILVAIKDTSGKIIQWQFSTTNNSVELYDTSGRLTTIIDVQGNVTRLSYNAISGLLENATNNVGESFQLVYSGQNISQITDHTGRVWAYGYDASGHLKSVVMPDSTRKQYLYQDTMNPNALTAIIDESTTRQVTIEYDFFGKAYASYHGPVTPVLTDRVDGITIDSTTPTAPIVTDSRGNASTYNLSLYNNIPLIDSIAGPGCTDCGNGNSTYSYDANSNLLSKTVEGLKTRFDNYDTKGNPGVMFEADGTAKARQTTYTYDARFFSKVLKKTEPSVFATGTKITNYIHDSFGNTTQIKIDGFTPAGSQVSRIIDMEYSGPLNQLTKINGPRADVSDITTLTYYANDTTQGNNRARLKTITSSGIILRDNIQYTPTGKVQAETRPNGLRITNTYYPGNDRLQTSTEATGTVSRVIKWTYQATGEVASITTADGTLDVAIITLSYDGARRLIRITDGLGNYIKYTLDTEGNQTNEDIYDAGNVLRKALTQTFDAYNWLNTTATANETQTYNFLPDGSLDTQTDGNNKITQYTYDELKRLSTTTQDKNGTNPDTADVLTQYGYDIADRLTSVIDPESGNTTYAYDDLGNLLAETSPDTGSKTYTHDEAGNTATLTDAKGQVFNYTYDQLNRLTNINAPGTSDDTRYIYDSCQNGTGKLCSIINSQTTINYNYNGFGEPTDHQGISYTYDNAGRTKTISYPSGAIVTYNHDSAGQITQVSLDQNGQQTTLADNITYTPFGPIKTLTYGNGKTLNQSIDQAYRLSQQNTVGVLEFDYAQYDANGNLQTRIDTQANTTSNFTYDELSRLDSANGLFGNNGYGYDRNGNRASASSGSTIDSFTYTTNSNRLNTYNNVSVSLDANGNTTVIRDLALTYNIYNRLVDVKNGTYTYQYNGAGQRFSKTAAQPTPAQPGQTGDANNDGRINPADRQSILNQILGINTAPGVADCNQDTNVNVLDLVCLNNLINTQASNTTLTTTNYVYSLSGQLLSESTNTPTSEYIYLNGQPLAVINSNQVYYAHNDHLGTPQKLSNASGAVVWSAIYDPFGNAIVNEDVDNDGNNVVFNLRFPGQYYDAESGLHYNYFRYYDPSTGRYITSDPIGLDGGLNTYEYVYNNPLNWIDTYGLAGHINNQRPSNLPKHQKGDSRRSADQGGEKGDNKRRPHSKRPNKWKGKWPTKQGGYVSPTLVLKLYTGIGLLFTPSELGCGVLDCDQNGIPDYLEIPEDSNSSCSQ